MRGAREKPLKTRQRSSRPRTRNRVLLLDPHVYSPMCIYTYIHIIYSISCWSHKCIIIYRDIHLSKEIHPLEFFFIRTNFRAFLVSRFISWCRGLCITAFIFCRRHGTNGARADWYTSYSDVPGRFIDLFPCNY
jgi:hypothetical protein